MVASSMLLLLSRESWCCRSSWPGLQLMAMADRPSSLRSRALPRARRALSVAGLLPALTRDGRGPDREEACGSDRD